MKPISSAIKSRIIFLLRSNHSTHDIASQTGVSQSTVARIRKMEGINVSANRTGRPRVLTVQDERSIVRAVSTGKHSNAVEAQRQLDTESGVRVSADTVRRVLKRNGLCARVKTRKPLLRPRHLRQRLAFARKYANWTVDDWKRVIWSDETKINVFGSDGRQYCYRRPGERIQPHHVQPTVKHGGGSLMLWGCFTSAGVGYACRIDGGMDAELYQSILQDDLLGTVEWFALERNEIYFQHDNDPKHTARSTKQWLSDNEIRVLDWPAQSPDLNPIEHLWRHLKQRLAAYDNPPKGVHDLWERVEKEWEAIDPDYCARLVASMPARMAAVLKAKGGYTKW